MKISKFCCYLIPIAGLSLGLVTTPISAHEYWFGLAWGKIQPGERFSGDLRVGQMLKGMSLPYLSRSSKSLSIWDGVEKKPVDSIEGDLPAVSIIAQREGLHVLAQETTSSKISYDDPEKFKSYLENEGLQQFKEIHRQRGLPDSGFDERYYRCAKALIQVGPVAPQHQDIKTGMPIEIIALSNPHDEQTRQMRVRLLWQDAPLGNWQINVFHSTGEVTRKSIKTDARGEAEFPLVHEGFYMLNAVHLKAVDSFPVVWESHWASLSFSYRSTSNGG